MRVLLVNLPWIKDNRYGVRAGSRWPFTLRMGGKGQREYLPFPFFLAYATSFLKENKKEAMLIDAVAERMAEDVFIERVKQYAPGLLVVETSTPSFNNDIKIVQKLIQEVNKMKVAFCGPHASVFPSQILKEHRFIDYILIGEYENTLCELIECLEEGSSLDNVLGIGHKTEATVKINQLRPTIKNLDALPWPERETVPLYNYNDGFCNLPQPNVQVLASRGCPYQCIFCLWPQSMYGEHLYRKRNSGNVVDEIEWLLRRYDFKAIYFDDDTFNIDRNYVIEICNQLISRGITIPWAVMARPDLMDEELLGIMASSGLYAVKYGIESGNQQIVHNSKKNIDLNKAKQTIASTKRRGIKVHLTFCLGLPGETKASIQESLRFLGAVNPDSFQFSLATPFPGTELFNHLQAAGHLVSRQWYDYDANYRAVARTDSLSAEDLERELQRVRNVLKGYEQANIAK